MRRLPGILLLALCLMGPSVPARSWHGTASDNPFIAAMRTMMRMMGLLDDDPYPWLNPFLPNPTPLPGAGAWSPYTALPAAGALATQPYASMMPGLGGGLAQTIPFGGLGQMGQLGQYYRQGQNWMRQAWPAANTDDADGLEGKWRGRNGEWLVIGRGMFRLYVSRDEYVQGDERHTDRYISFRNNDNQVVKTYEYAIRDGRMILRDEDGNLLLFKKQS